MSGNRKKIALHEAFPFCQIKNFGIGFLEFAYKNTSPRGKVSTTNLKEDHCMSHQKDGFGHNILASASLSLTGEVAPACTLKCGDKTIGDTYC